MGFRQLLPVIIVHLESWQKNYPNADTPYVDSFPEVRLLQKLPRGAFGKHF